MSRSATKTRGCPREGRHDGRAEERWRQAELEIEQALRSAEAQAAEAPEQPPKGEALAALQASDLDAAVPLLDRLDPSHVRRGRPLRRGRNPAGRPGRCRLPASAGCS